MTSHVQPVFPITDALILAAVFVVLTKFLTGKWPWEGPWKGM